MSKPIFFEPEQVGKRDWGEEILVAHSEGKYIGKLIKLNKGHKGGLQYHRLKDESGILISGKMLVRYIENNEVVEKTVEPYQSWRFAPGVEHQTEAIEDCEYVEFSTPHLNDRVRVEEKYGLEGGCGLPTTQLEDIVIK